MNEQSIEDRIRNPKKLDATSDDARQIYSGPPSPMKIDKPVEGLDSRPAGETMDSSTTLLDDLALYFRVRLVRIIGDEQAGKATELLPVNPLKLFSLATGWWKGLVAVVIGIILYFILRAKKS